MHLHLPINRAHFFKKYRVHLGRLRQDQVDGLNVVLDFIEADKLLCDNHQWVAYVLATIKHECADTWRPICEVGTPRYFVTNYYHKERVRNALQNKSIEDAVLYCGRGYVQITGRGHYATFSKRLKVDLLTNPDRACEPVISWKITSQGMRLGLFTGRKLSQYITAHEADYKEARRVVNGTDRAALLASYAEAFEDMLYPPKSHTTTISV